MDLRIRCLGPAGGVPSFSVLEAPPINDSVGTLEIAIGVALGIILTVLLAVEREARLAKRESRRISPSNQ
jgi:hypothetical protein